MDGLEGLKDVILLAATNRPDMLDPALLRSGRFGRHIEIPMPDKESRKAIFEIHLTNKPLEKSVDLDKLAEDLDGYTGADIQALSEEATLLTIREAVANPEIITNNAESVKSVEITREILIKSIEKIKTTADRATKAEERSAKVADDMVS